MALSYLQLANKGSNNVPTFELVSLNEAQLELTLSGKRGAILREYVDIVRSMEPGQAGKVTANEGETTAGIRRRLATAADLLGQSLVLNRQDNVVYFWEEGDGPSPVRRRRRSSAQSEE